MASRILAGRYELLDKIGEGGMAVVFKAKDRLLNRYVAIKILRPEYTKDSVFIEGFRRESQMAAGLTHPNIVNIYDVGKEGNIYYIVMELMDGCPLSELIKREGPLDPQRAAIITRQIASALSAAHKNHLIHRDVKPHNIMFSSDGSAKIADFGIAKKVSGETIMGEKKENVMGSVHYFSPEQATGTYVDERSDIYSLGICLYEMLTGKVPFDGESAVEVAVKHMNNIMVPPKDVNPNIPQDLNDIVMKATNKNPEYRYKTMDDFITALNFVSYNKHHVVEEKHVQDFADLFDTKEDFSSNDDFLIGKESTINEVKQEQPEVPQLDRMTVSSLYGTRGSYVKYETPRKKKKRFWLSPQRYIGVLIAIALAFFASSYIYKYFTQEKPVVITEVEVISLEGKTVEEAEKALSELGLKLEVDLELISKEVPEGLIMSQTPKAGSIVKTDQTVHVNVSKGEVPGTVPNVVGKSLRNAKALIESYGYKLVVGGYQEDKTIDKDYIISQNPSSGKELKEGGTVTVVISTGGPAEKEYDIIGKSYAEAVEILAEDGISVGVRTNQSSNEIEEGCVIKYIVNGDKVDLYISSGRAGAGTGETVVDGYVTYTISFSEVQTENEAFTAKISIVDDNGSRTLSENCIVEEGSKTFYIGGAGEDGTVTIVAENMIFQLHHVNFKTGEYE